MRLGHLPDDFPACLLKAARRGLIEGGFMYAYEAITDRLRRSVMAAQKDSAPASASVFPPTAGDDDEKPDLPENKNVSWASE